MIFFISIFLLVFYNIQKEIKITAKITSKIANLSNEPCIGIIKSSREGLSCIKKQKLEVYISDIWNELIAKVLNSDYSRQSVTRYQLLRLNISGLFIISAFLVMLSISKIDVNFISVSLTYSLMVLDNFQSWLMNIRHMEIGSASLERINELVETEQEENGEKNIYDNNNISCNDINIDNLACGYEKFQCVLSNFCLNIKSGEKVLLIGRTGSGKTTIFNCLTKLIDYEGSLKIGGTEVREIQTEKLRKIIFSIPQKTFLFPGTVRESIDPYCEYKDSEIFDALEKVNLKNKILSLENSLQTTVTPFNDLFSSGERQLLYLVRAILCKPSIILIDEGNSNINEEMNDIFYRIIKENFIATTVISISHNISDTSFYDDIINIESYSVM
ncbi:MAG: ATP-binding cassette domain-containing protein [Clostridiaceae bacterium]|nr:ATP-binding cassette domain-containing protein [Clostridiaceae bacterium]